MVVARRYARALYEEAERASKTGEVDEDVALIRSSLDDIPELARFFESPVITREKKQAVIEKLFADRVDRVTIQFLQMLVRKQREDVFPHIADAYGAMRDEQLGIVAAQARSARDLSADEQTDLIEALERMTGKKVRLEVSKDPDLVGGLVIRINDTVYDGSVRHQLERLRDRMELGSISLN